MKSSDKNSTAFSLLMVLCMAAVAMLSCAGVLKAAEFTSQVPGQQAFSSPEEAGQALEIAAQAHDEAGLTKILGSETRTLISSGNAAVDKTAQDSFVAKFKQMNRWVTMTDGSEVLYVGADNYAFPIPLAQISSSKWLFDGDAGEEEITSRQIGRNELLAMDACSAIASAEEIYFETAHDGNPAYQYTSKIISNPGKQDGLYWADSKGQISRSLEVLGEFVKNGVPNKSKDGAQELDGYSFRILTASEGTTKGFAVIASPVEYGRSGIMTFLLTREGIIYDKDFGEKTAEIVPMISFNNLSEGWTQVKLDD
jgi:hypothetical protein